MKKIKSVLLALTLVMSFGFVPANAETVYDANSSGQSFSSDWVVTKVNTADKTFKYGYNTSLINEDYTHTYHRTINHYAYVKNTGTAQNLKGFAGSYAKAEITHYSGTVYYRYSY